MIIMEKRVSNEYVTRTYSDATYSQECALYKPLNNELRARLNF